MPMPFRRSKGGHTMPSGFPLLLAALAVVFVALAYAHSRH